MERPNIKDFFHEKADLETVHSEYTKSPHLYSYSSALDRYIDYLEDKYLKDKDIEVRKQVFMQKVANFKGQYPDEMLREFYDYWTEHGERDRKFRKEKEKSFDVSKRLARWYKNYKPSKNQPTVNRQTEETVRKNLEEVGEDFINQIRGK